MSTQEKGKKDRATANQKAKRPDLRVWRPLFLRALADSGNVRYAAQLAGVTRDAIYKAKERSPQFAEEYEQAMADAVDVLEMTAWTRARATSDTLLIFLLKAHRPEMYREPGRKLTVEAEAGSGGQGVDGKGSGEVVFRFEYSEDAEE